ncbi:DUF3794 domain-containing protein [Desertibacillus haloalkaliphilus]|nr:DUF3794 domain-containing protein [Desertibacillus haloalkaliphilus]MBU8907400.1 DUF3794 domain-containing protein [Desertibacillus haloalkaliphilus]
MMTDFNKHDKTSKGHKKVNNDYAPPPYFKHQPKKRKNAVLPEASNREMEPEIAVGKAFVKVPVVLAEDTVQIDMNAKIDFPEPVLEIKEVKKNLKVTQCRLLLPTNKLFIKGFVRKNIQYATPTHGSKESVVSNIRSLTTDIPFEIVTPINLKREPQFKAQPGQTEFSYFTTSPLPKGFAEKEKLLSADLAQFDQISGENFNELPFCELISSRFIEVDEALDRKMGRVYDHRGKEIDAPFEEGTFTSVEEKMVVELTVKVLQNQQLHVKSKKHKKHKY